MHVPILKKLFVAMAVGVVLAFPLAFGASADALEPFGGPAHEVGQATTEVIADTGLADQPLLVEETPHYVLLAQSVEDEANDPLEPLNRAIFGFNEVVYTAVLDPVAEVYNTVVPGTMRAMISNLIDHLTSPVTLANDILQLEIHRALTTIARFTVNTVAGMGGIADVASSIGLEEHSEDFGQTLGVYGVGEGLYLVLPLLGPSNPRDAVGRYLVDSYFDPLGLYLSNTERDAERYARTGVSALDEYAGIKDELEQIRRTSVDYYAAIRSLYRQRRATEISNGREQDLPAIPNYDLNFAPEKDGSVAIAK